MSKSRKIVMMLVALLGAVILWLYVITAVAPEATTRVSSIPINIDGTIVLEERGLMITTQDVNTLSLELSTSRVNLNKLNAETIRVNADASKIREPGEYALTCTVNFPDTVRSSDVDLIRKSVDTVNVTVTRLETKAVPVSLTWTGGVKDGYLLEAENVLFEPAEIVVYGPESDVNQVVKAVVSYDVSDMVETVVENLPVTFVNASGAEVRFTSEFTSANATQVSMTLPMYRTKELTLALNTQEGGGVTVDNAQITIEPKVIRVKGAAEVIDQMEDVLVLGTVDLSEVSDGEDLSYTINLPAAVTNLSGETEAVATVRISGVTTDIINISDIRLVNAPSNYKYESSTRTAWVTVRGSTKEINEIKLSENNGFYIVVDLKDYTDTGVYSIPGKVVNEDHPGVSAPDTVEIGVEVSMLEPEPSGDEG